MRAKEFINEDVDLDEGWKDMLGNLVISLGIATGGLAGMTIKQALSSPEVPPETKQEIVQKANIPSEVVKKFVVQTPKPNINKDQKLASIPEPEKTINLSGTAHEETLIKAAKAAGLTGTELAAFLAQCAHESADFTRMTERGSARYFRKYDPKYNPAKAKILGNKYIGDGAKYKGRGYIQLTGRYNYRVAGKAIGVDLEKNPKLAENPAIAAKVALWFWQSKVQPRVDNFKNVAQVTKPINPALNGLHDRKQNFRDYLVAMK